MDIYIKIYVVWSELLLDCLGQSHTVYLPVSNFNVLPDTSDKSSKIHFARPDSTQSLGYIYWNINTIYRSQASQCVGRTWLSSFHYYHSHRNNPPEEQALGVRPTG